LDCVSSDAAASIEGEQEMKLHSDDTTEHCTPCAIYARTAQENMAEIDRQVEACFLRAAALGAEVQFLFIDNGVSGMVIGEGLEHLLETARVGGFDYVVVADHDRLARSFSVKSFVLAELSTAGVEVEKACEPFRPRELDDINRGFQ
jgi:DNA invertase Pin-like site-specific DNA recombinase